MDRDDHDADRRDERWDDVRDEALGFEGGELPGPVPQAAEGRRSCAPRHYQRADHRIRDDVYDRLCGPTGADASDVTVVVHDGTVTLTGSVPEPEDERRILRIAERVPGVKSVVNYLRVLAPA
jgi:hypothetical protein